MPPPSQPGRGKNLYGVRSASAIAPKFFFSSVARICYCWLTAEICVKISRFSIGGSTRWVNAERSAQGTGLADSGMCQIDVSDRDIG